MKLRHVAKFESIYSKQEFISWFCDEIKVVNSLFKISISENKYDTSLSINYDDSEMSYSIVENPREGGLLLFADPKLKFLEAIFGKEDLKQKKAILLAHEILSNSDKISGLGWLLSQQAWMTPTLNP